jgi:hypothetical protein
MECFFQAEWQNYDKKIEGANVYLSFKDLVSLKRFEFQAKKYP